MDRPRHSRRPLVGSHLNVSASEAHRCGTPGRCPRTHVGADGPAPPDVLPVADAGEDHPDPVTKDWFDVSGPGEAARQCAAPRLLSAKPLASSVQMGQSARPADTP